jgi:hypothetical protein
MGTPFEAQGRAVHQQDAGEVRLDALEVFDSRSIVESRIVTVKVHFYPGTFERSVSYRAGSWACPSQSRLKQTFGVVLFKRLLRMALKATRR